MWFECTYSWFLHKVQKNQDPKERQNSRGEQKQRDVNERLESVEPAHEWKLNNNKNAGHALSLRAWGE